MRYGLDEIMKRFKKAVIKHHLIADSSDIMVGLSGGKDSLCLLYVLKAFQSISKYKYRLAAGHVALGFPGEDLSQMEDYCRSLNIPFYAEKTRIGPIVFESRQERNPCSLCAKMRRGALNNLAKAQGYHKVALAHHQGDVIETLLLKTFFEGRLASFNPLTYLDRQDLTVIRPLVYVPEPQIAYFARKEKLPITPSCCPANGHTKRQDMKELLRQIDALSPFARDRALGALDKQFGSGWDGRNSAPFTAAAPEEYYPKEENDESIG